MLASLICIFCYFFAFQGKPGNLGELPPPNSNSAETQEERHTRHGPDTNSDGGKSCFDGTGLLVWPGCRLLATFLVDPRGVRHHFPYLVAGQGEISNGAHYCGSGDKTFCSIGQDEGANTTQKCTQPRKSAPACGGESFAGLCDGDIFKKNVRHTAFILNEIEHPTPGAVGISINNRRNEETHYRTARSLSSGHCGNPLASRLHDRGAVLELGAGTGICGMVASMTLNRPAILTDRRDDVIVNLGRNIRLNGLEKRVRAVPLAWGGELCEQLPIEIRARAPFQVPDIAAHKQP